MRIGEMFEARVVRDLAEAAHAARAFALMLGIAAEGGFPV